MDNEKTPQTNQDQPPVSDKQIQQDTSPDTVQSLPLNIKENLPKTKHISLKPKPIKNRQILDFLMSFLSPFTGQIKLNLGLQEKYALPLCLHQHALLQKVSF